MLTCPDYLRIRTSNARRPQASSGDPKGGHYKRGAGEDRMMTVENLKPKKGETDIVRLCKATEEKPLRINQALVWVAGRGR
jgi:hypothetical protein